MVTYVAIVLYTFGSRYTFVKVYRWVHFLLSKCTNPYTFVKVYRHWNSFFVLSTTSAKRDGGAMRGGCACGQLAPALENERGRQKK
jgi:hypothetical protein